MVTQHYQIVECDVCKQVKHGGNVTFNEETHVTVLAICDECEGDK